MAQVFGARTVWAVRWLVAILLLAGLAGVLIARIHTANQTYHLATAPSTSGTTMATGGRSSLSATAAHAGQEAPDFSFTPVNGAALSTIRLSNLRGHVVVVNFWSPTCAPCHDEAPALAHAARQYTGQGVVFLGVAFEGAREDVVAFLRQYHIPYLCGLDSAYSIATAYGLLAIPVTVVVDRAGVVARVIQGAVSAASLGAAVATALDQRA